MSNLKSLTLRDVCQATQGVQIPKSSQSKIKKKNFKRYFYISDFTHDKNLKYVEDIYPKKNFTCEDIIVSNTGSHGEVFTGKEGILSNNLFKVTFNKEIINGSFLVLFLKSNLFKDFQLKRVKGTANPHMGHENFLNTPLILPSLVIQQKIVAKLDKIFAEIDKATAAAEANALHAKLLFDSYLRQVFNKYGNSSGVKYLSEIAQNLDSKRMPITKRIREKGSIPYYGASGIVDYVKDFIFDDDILLISEDGANLLARTYPIAFSVSGKCWVNNHVHVVKFSNIISQKFVEFYLNSISLKPYVSGMAQPKLNQARLNKISIPFPSLEQQTKIVTNFNSIRELTNNLVEFYLNKKNNLTTLKQSILQQAFNGELVKAA